jgi:hypothetical protein
MTAEQKISAAERAFDDTAEFVPMTVKDLRQALKGLPGDMAVVMADLRPVTAAEVGEGGLDEPYFVISDPDPEDD